MATSARVPESGAPRKVEVTLRKGSESENDKQIRIEKAANSFEVTKQIRDERAKIEREFREKEEIKAARAKLESNRPEKQDPRAAFDALFKKENNE